MVKPKKHLGQHFLTDPSVANRIVDSLDIDETSNVLEIGPGKGVLTELLLNKKEIKLKVIELDSESSDYLNEHYPSLEVIRGNFLKIDLSETFNTESFKIIGNFPYNISSQIVFAILDNRLLIDEMVGMFQKEVAKRICSEPGSKEYGILSVLTQLNYDTKYLFTVNEGVFFPPPKVKSGVIRLKRKDELIGDDQFKKMRTLVKMAFNQRRKQLRNSIKGFLPENFDHPYLTKRPEQLHYSEFVELLEAIKAG